MHYFRCIHLLIMVILVGFLTITCNKPVSVPTLTTYAITNISPTQATGGGNITSDGRGEIISRGVCWSTTPEPTVNGSRTMDGTGVGSFSSTIDNLSPGTTYYVRAYAANSAGTSYGSEVTFKSVLGDSDGNVYNEVIIGGQTWMRENLKTTKYNDGTPIPNGADINLWATLKSAAYCFYNNNVGNKSVYGALYNWYAVNTGKLCPKGWHVPTDAEWSTLQNFVSPTYTTGTLAGRNVAGGKLKATGTDYWKSPNTGASNSTGFNALPAGYRVAINGSFVYLGEVSIWWSSTSDNTDNAFTWDVTHDQDMMWRHNNNKSHGFSVRCLKD